MAGRKISSVPTGNPDPGDFFVYHDISEVDPALAIKRAPVSTLPIITSKDLEVTDLTKGVILKSPNGNRWRITINNAGALVMTAL